MYKHAVFNASQKRDNETIQEKKKKKKKKNGQVGRAITPAHGIQPRRTRSNLFLLVVVIEPLRRHRLLEAPRLRLKSSLLLLLLLLKYNVIEPRVLQSIVSTYAELRTKLKHALNQVDAGGINGVKNAPQILSCVHLERGLVLWQLRNSRP